MNTLSSMLKFIGNKINMLHTDYLAITTIDVSFTQNAATQAMHTGTGTKSGYYPIGICGWSFSGTGVGQLVPYMFYLENQANGSTGVRVGIRNNNTSSNITGTLTVRVLWRKLGGVAHRIKSCICSALRNWGGVL